MALTKDYRQRAMADDGLDALNLLGSAFLDPWYVVDEEDRIIEFNSAFHALFPRAVARNLKNMTCRDAAALPACATQACLRVTCRQSGPLRFDEVDTEVGGEKLRLILTAVSLPLGSSRTGALILLRNVTDEARVQSGYQRMVESAGALRKELEERLNQRTRDLLSANAELNKLEQLIARLKRGGV